MEQGPREGQRWEGRDGGSKRRWSREQGVEKNEGGNNGGIRYEVRRERERE